MVLYGSSLHFLLLINTRGVTERTICQLVIQRSMSKKQNWCKVLYYIIHVLICKWCNINTPFSCLQKWFSLTWKFWYKTFYINARLNTRHFWTSHNQNSSEAKLNLQYFKGHVILYFIIFCKMSIFVSADFDWFFFRIFLFRNYTIAVDVHVFRLTF